LPTTLQRSGLLRTSSDLTRVRIHRLDPVTGQTSEWLVDCTQPLGEAPLWLRHGDVIEVPERAGGTVSVMGEVRNPGLFELAGERAWDLFEVVAARGGLTDFARDEVLLTRDGVTRAFSLEKLKRETDPANQVRLQDGDAIMVKRKDF
jgi:protein involved in polysaccharide export with SLBB domain